MFTEGCWAHGDENANEPGGGIDLNAILLGTVSGDGERNDDIRAYGDASKRVTCRNFGQSNSIFAVVASRYPSMSGSVA